ncbi:hypothetical protein DPMN_176300 [Dreissena polymorpha]|uniref:Uncharacterized protein n=1 Tax=Dreissena polymorpha TaxID=45954 RepID=A0A9D4IGS8_DREPO|nr:hypothetical protein DPMN_176300 [Dreissena polymorpha]
MFVIRPHRSSKSRLHRPLINSCCPGTLVGCLDTSSRGGGASGKGLVWFSCFFQVAKLLGCLMHFGTNI